MWRHTVLFLAVFLLTLDEGLCSKLAKPIKQVYRQFKQGFWRDERTNTVRYMEPLDYKNASDGRLVFSMEGIDDPKMINSAQLYFHRRNTEQGRKIYIEVAEVSQQNDYKVRHQLLVSDAGEPEGWKSYNITISVVECVSTVEYKHQLEISFTEFQQPIDLQSFLHHSSPYLLIHSYDGAGITQDQIQGRAGEGREEWLSELDSVRGKRHVNSREKRELSEDKDRAFNYIQSQNEQSWDSDADWEGEFTNEIDSDGNIVKVEKNGLEAFPTLGHKDIRITPLSSGQMSEVERRIVEEERKRSKVTKKENILPWPSAEEVRRHKAERQRANKGCRRQSSVIHWEDLGWQRRIISPKKFDSYMCAGLCTFPFNQGTEGTNHATLHSLLRAIRPDSNKGFPCCVADKMSDLTVLFYDDFGNTVVKNYPNMIVDSCTCR